jgi:hypothetical protein
VGITFRRILSSYWIDYLGFLLRKKLVAIFITPCSWGFPTGRLFLLHQLGPIKFFWRRCREEEDFCEGSFYMHILYFVLSFALLYFYLHHFIKNLKN